MGAAWGRAWGSVGLCWGTANAGAEQHVAEQWVQNGAALGRSMRPRWSALGRSIGPCWGGGAAGGAPRGVAQGCSMRLRMRESWGRGCA